MNFCLTHISVRFPRMPLGFLLPLHFEAEVQIYSFRGFQKFPLTHLRPACQYLLLFIFLFEQHNKQLSNKCQISKWVHTFDYILSVIYKEWKLHLQAQNLTYTGTTIFFRFPLKKSFFFYFSDGALIVFKEATVRLSSLRTSDRVSSIVVVALWCGPAFLSGTDALGKNED